MPTKPLDSPDATPEPAVILTRSSTVEQVNSILVQDAMARRYCEAAKLNPFVTITDSGTSAEKVAFFDRPKVAEMFALMRLHGIRHIVLAKQDRGFRDTEDCLKTIRILNKGLREGERVAVDVAGMQGVAIHIVEDNIDSRDERSMLLLTIKAAVAQEENRKRNERIRDTLAEIKPKGHRIGGIPYGKDAVKCMSRVSKTGRQADDLVDNPHEQRWLRQILAWHDEGETDHEIKRRLNAAGVKTKLAGQPMSRKVKDAAGNVLRVKHWVCDGQWEAATVLAVRRNGRLSEAYAQAGPPSHTAAQRLAAA